jgi:hypothetical protein
MLDASGSVRELRRTVAVRFFSVALLILLAQTPCAFGQTQRPVSAAPASCSFFDPASTVHSNADAVHDVDLNRLLAAYNAQARLVRSMKAVAIIRATRGPKFGARAGTSHPITGLFDFEQPSSLRATGVVPPSGRKVFDLSSDGREFHLLASDHDTMKFFVGLVDAQPNAPEIQELEISDIARPREILDALRWQEGTLRHTGTSATARKDVLEFDLPPRAGKSITGKLQFDPQNGAVSSLRFHNADGELISEVFYADWQPLSGAEGGASQGCFPRRVRLVQPMEDVQLDFRFLELTLNPRIPRASFRVNPTPGTPVVRLSRTATEREH